MEYKFSDMVNVVNGIISPFYNNFGNNDIQTENNYIYVTNFYRLDNAERAFNALENGIKLFETAKIDMEYYKRIKKDNKKERDYYDDLSKYTLTMTDEEQYNNILALFIYLYYDIEGTAKDNFKKTTWSNYHVPHMTNTEYYKLNSLINSSTNEPIIDTFMETFFERLAKKSDSKYFLNDLNYNICAVNKIKLNELQNPPKSEQYNYDKLYALYKKYHYLYKDISTNIKDPIFYVLRNYIITNLKYYNKDNFKNYIIGQNVNMLSVFKNNRKCFNEYFIERILYNVYNSFIDEYTIIDKKSYSDILNKIINEVKQSICDMFKLFIDKGRKNKANNYRLYLRHYFMFEPLIMLKCFNNAKMIMEVTDSNRTYKLEEAIYKAIKTGKEFYLENKDILYEILNSFISFQAKQNYFKYDSVVMFDHIYTYNFRRYIYYVILTYIKNEVLRVASEGKDVFKELGVNKTNQTLFLLNDILE